MRIANLYFIRYYLAKIPFMENGDKCKWTEGGLISPEVLLNPVRTSVVKESVFLSMVLDLKFKNTKINEIKLQNIDFKSYIN